MKKVIKFILSDVDGIDADVSIIEMRITDNGLDEQWLEGYMEMNEKFLKQYFTVTRWDK